jgi:hypothetical protein
MTINTIPPTIIILVIISVFSLFIVFIICGVVIGTGVVVDTIVGLYIESIKVIGTSFSSVFVNEELQCGVKNSSIACFKNGTVSIKAATLFSNLARS